jgi:uncharacterized membrane protein
VSIETLAFVLWGSVSALAVVSLVYLAYTFSRIDRGIRARLDELLARGEIDIDEYRARVTVLRG